MTWLLQHKFFTLVIIAGAVYWFGNPSGQFGFVRQGIAIYNHIPIVFLDCYIGPDGRLHPESQLENAVNVRYWFDQHFVSYHDSGSIMLPLLIGNGFSDSSRIAIDPAMLRACRDRWFDPQSYSSPEAIEKYNALRTQGKKAAILLKLK
jgi:hypothetical protein